MIWIVSVDYEFEERSIESELVRRDLPYLFIDPRRVAYHVEGSTIRIIYRGTPLSRPDVALVRQTRFGHTSSLHLLRALSILGVRTIESYETISRGVSKVIGIMEAANSGFQTPTTIVSESLEETLPLLRNARFPLIVKPIDGWRGEGIAQLSDHESLSAIRVPERPSNLPYYDADRQIFTQEQLRIENEYRVLVLGYTSLGVALKLGSPGRIPRNVAQGGQLLQIHGRPDIESLAERIARLRRRELAGVDIAETSDGLYVLECNRNPQFRGFMEAHPETNVPHLIVDYLVAAVKQMK